MAAGAIDGPGHWVGGLRSDEHGLPLVGWSTTGGDLRVPHFFATHLMQALPLTGWLADRLLPARARTLVWAAAALGLLVIAVYWLLKLDVPPVAGFFAAVLLTFLGTALLYVGLVRPIWFLRPLFGMKALAAPTTRSVERKAQPEAAPRKG